MDDGWILSHTYTPALIYMYTRNPLLVFTIIYVWESIELSLVYMGVASMEEGIVDTLIIDPLSALVGVLLAHAFVSYKRGDSIFTLYGPRPDSINLEYKILHILVITAGSAACLAEKEEIGFIVFISVYCGTTFFMSAEYSDAELFEWAIITGFLMTITAVVVLAIGKAAPIVAFLVPFVVMPLVVVIPPIPWLSQDPLAEEPKKSVSQSVTLGEWRP
mgnify:CR=1 FL=1